MTMKRNKPLVDDALREATQRNYEAISGSQVFCVLFNEAMVQEVIPLIQMGLAIYLDKPIVLLVPKGATVPINLRTLAGAAIEEFDPNNPDSLDAATTRLHEQGRI